MDFQQLVYINDKHIDLKQLPHVIQDLLAKDVDLKVIISADKDTPYTMIMTLLDMLRLVGCYNIILETSSSRPHE